MQTLKKPVTIGDILKSEADQQSRVAVPAGAGVKVGQLVKYPLRDEFLVALTDEIHGETLVQPHNCKIFLDSVNQADIDSAGVTVANLKTQGDAHGIIYIGTPYVIAAQTAAALAINPVAGDGVINATEDDADVTISGTSTDVADATPVSVTVNSKTYTGTVTSNAWSVTMPAADAQALPEDVAQTITVTATVDGSTVTATGTVTHNAYG